MNIPGVNKKKVPAAPQLSELNQNLPAHRLLRNNQYKLPGRQVQNENIFNGDQPLKRANTLNPIEPFGISSNAVQIHDHNLIGRNSKPTKVTKEDIKIANYEHALNEDLGALGMKSNSNPIGHDDILTDRTHNAFGEKKTSR